MRRTLVTLPLIIALSCSVVFAQEAPKKAKAATGKSHTRKKIKRPRPAQLKKRAEIEGKRQEMESRRREFQQMQKAQRRGMMQMQQQQKAVPGQKHP